MSEESKLKNLQSVPKMVAGAILAASSFAAGMYVYSTITDSRVVVLLSLAGVVFGLVTGGEGLLKKGCADCDKRLEDFWIYVGRSRSTGERENHQAILDALESRDAERLLGAVKGSHIHAKENTEQWLSLSLEHCPGCERVALVTVVPCKEVGGTTTSKEVTGSDVKDLIGMAKSLKASASA